MNVAIATVAKDVGTTITGIQTRDHALHAGDGDADDHRRQDRVDDRATTRLHDRLCHLRRGFADDRPGAEPDGADLGWSLLEGIGAALIMPAIVALVAANFPPKGRPARLRAGHGVRAPIAVAVGPLIGGDRDDVLLLAVGVRRRGAWSCSASSCWHAHVNDDAAGRAGAPRHHRLGADGGRAGPGCLRGAAVGGMGLGGPQGRAAPSLWGVSPTLWLILAGRADDLGLLRVGGARRGRTGASRWCGPRCFANRQMTGGLVMFFFQYLVQAGLFFTIPLFLSVSLGLTALETGVRHPAALDHAAAGRGGRARRCSRRRRRAGWSGSACSPCSLGLVVLFAALDADATAEIVTVPAAARGPRDRRPGLAAGRGDRVRGPGRAEPGGGGPAEHRDEPRARRSAPRWRGRSSSPR